MLIHKASRSLLSLRSSSYRIFLSTSDDKASTRPTAWLDGMRGLASLIVVVFHFHQPYYPSILYGYGISATDQEPSRSIIQLPIIRLLYHGGAMVTHFFVISGFSISYKPTRLLREHEWGRLLQNISSSSFKRLGRIGFPYIAASFLYLVVLRLQFFDKWIPTPGTPLLPFASEIRRWIVVTGRQLNIWSVGDKSTYLTENIYCSQSWTLRLELRCSFWIYLIIITMCRVKSYLRFAILFAIGCHFQYQGLWDLQCFLCGMMLSEIDFRPRQKQSSRKKDGLVCEASSRSSEGSLISDWKWIASCTVALFLLSTPQNEGEKTLGYQLLMKITPQPSYAESRFLQTVGSTLLIWSVGKSTWLQRMFTTPFAQYLGKVSYSLYVTHHVVNETLAFHAIRVAQDWITGKDTPLTFELGMLSGLLVCVPAFFGLAHLFWLFVESKSVIMLSWIDEKINEA